jgi:flagellar basal body-associated protein FliL
MAEVEEGANEAAGKPKRAPKPKPVKVAGSGGGGLSPAAIIPWVVAVAALGMCVFMYMQLNTLSAKMKSDTGPTPKGVADADAEGGGAAEGEGMATEDWTPQPADVEYEFPEMTVNTADGSYAKLTFTARLESFYEMTEWEAYMALMKKYEEDRQLYFDYTSGKVDAEGKEIKKKAKKKGEEALRPSGLILAGGPAYPGGGGKPELILAEGGEGKAVEPPKLPEEPARPPTVMEKELKLKEIEVRDAIAAIINSKNAADLTSPEGRVEFKQEIIDVLNKCIERHFGTVKDVYFKDLLTT